MEPTPQRAICQYWRQFQICITFSSFFLVSYCIDICEMTCAQAFFIAAAYSKTLETLMLSMGHWIYKLVYPYTGKLCSYQKEWEGFKTSIFHGVTENTQRRVIKKSENLPLGKQFRELGHLGERKDLHVNTSAIFCHIDDISNCRGHTGTAGWKFHGDIGTM